MRGLLGLGLGWGLELGFKLWLKLGRFFHRQAGAGSSGSSSSSRRLNFPHAQVVCSLVGLIALSSLSSGCRMLSSRSGLSEPSSQGAPGGVSASKAAGSLNSSSAASTPPFQVKKRAVSADFFAEGKDAERLYRVLATLPSGTRLPSARRRSSVRAWVLCWEDTVCAAVALRASGTKREKLRLSEMKRLPGDLSLALQTQTTLLGQTEEAGRASRAVQQQRVVCDFLSAKQPPYGKQSYTCSLSVRSPLFSRLLSPELSAELVNLGRWPNLGKNSQPSQSAQSSKSGGFFSSMSARSRASAKAGGSDQHVLCKHGLSCQWQIRLAEGQVKTRDLSRRFTRELVQTLDAARIEYKQLKRQVEKARQLERRTQLRGRGKISRAGDQAQVQNPSEARGVWSTLHKALAPDWPSERSLLHRAHPLHCYPAVGGGLDLCTLRLVRR